MSTTIDQRVVEMRFDNKQFESNIQTSMSTLDKLKEKLNLSGASKGLEDINTAARNVNMSGLGSAVETVRTKFSALEVVAVTALANIANSAVNCGKRLVSSLTVEPIMDGFREYELTLNAVQTTMAGTGKTAEEVAAQLKVLDEYADKTVYSTADMLNNLPKFTNAGVELETATQAMIGIANATALAGGDAQKASIAFYNLGQAIGTGYLTRMDYNSINNAGIATIQWKEAMVEAAIAAGTLKKVGTDTYATLEGNTFKMQQLFIDGLQDQWATADVLLKVLGDYGDETTEIGKKAYAAATEIKTFTMMMESLKASAGTGWKETWEILFGDLEEAKKFWTGLYEAIAKVIDKMAEWRNTILAGALNYSGMDELIVKIEKAGYSAEDFNKILINVAKDNGIAIDDLIKEYGSLNEVIKSGKIPADIFKEALQRLLGVGDKAADSTNKMKISVEELGKVVDKVINGDFGNGEARIKALTQAGYDYATVQNAVNEKLGISYRHVSALTEAQKAQADQLVKLSDEQLKNKGYTEEQIKALRELEEAAKTSNTTIEELMESMTRPSGKELIFDTFAHLFGEMTKILNAFKEAWSNTFDPVTSEDVYNVIEKIHELAISFEISEEAVSNFKTIFEGLLAAFQLTNSIVSMSVVGSLKIANAVLNLFGTDILGVAAYVAELIIKLRDWVKENTFLIGTFDKIGAVIYTVINGIKRCVEAFLELDAVKEIVNKVKDKFVEWFGSLEKGLQLTGNIEKLNAVLESAFTRLENWIKSLEGLSMSEILEKLWTSIKNFGQEVLDACPSLEWLVGIIKDSIQPLKDWFATFKNSEVATGAFDTIINAFDKVKTRFTEAYEIGKNVIEGIKKGLEEGTVTIPQAIGTVIQGLINAAKKLLGIASPSKVFIAIGGFIIAGLVSGLLSNVPSVSEALQVIGDKIVNFFKDLDFETIIAAAVAVGALVVIKKVTDIMEGFSHAAKGFGDLASTLSTTLKNFNGAVLEYKPDKWTKVTKGIQRMAISIALLAGSVALLANVHQEGSLWQALGALGAIAAGVAALSAIMAVIGNIPGAEKVDKLSSTVLKLAAAMGIIVLVVKLSGTLTEADINNAQTVLGGFTVVITIFMAMSTLLSKNAQRIKAVGGMLLKISAAMAIMVVVAKVASGMSEEEMKKAGIAIGAFTAVISLLMVMTNVLSKNTSRIKAIGGSLLKIAAAMGIMILVAKIAGTMDYEEMVKAGIAITAFTGIIGLLMVMTKLIAQENKNISSIGGSLLKIAAAMGIMALVAKIAGSMELTEMLKAGAVITAFVGVIGVLMVMTRLVAQENANINSIGGALLKIAAAMGIMALVAKLAGTMEPNEMLKGAVAIGYFALIITGLMAATKLIGDSKNVESMGKNLLMVSGAIGILAAIAALLCLIPTEKLVPAVAALTVLMGAFTLVVAICNNASKVTKEQVGQLSLMVVVIGILAVIVATLSLIENPDAAVKTAAALSMLVVSLASAMAILEKARNVSDQDVRTAAIMALVIAELGLIIGILNGLGVTVPIDTAVSLGLLVNALATSMLILSTIKWLDMKTVGLAALMGLVVGEICAIVGILEKYDLAPSIETATGLSVLVLAISKAMAIVSAAGIAASGALAGMGLLAVFIAELTGILAILGKMASDPDTVAMIQNGSTMLSAIGRALGDFVGSIIAGFGEGVMSCLPTIGDYLSQFAENVSGFIDTVTGITEESAIGAKNLCTAILALTAAELINGVADLMNSDTSLVSLGYELSSFATAILPFLTNVALISPEMLAGVKSLAEAILILTAAEVVQGLASNIFGTEGGLAKFGEQLPDLGTNIAEFAQNLGDFSETNVTAVKCAGDAIKALALAANEIPNEGGWIAKLVGENSIATFGSYLPGLGTNIAAFAKNLGTFQEDNVTTIDCAGRAISALAKAANEIPNEGGWIAKLVGDNSIATFSDNLPPLGTNLAEFAKNLGTFGEAQIASINSAIKAIQALTGLANANLDDASDDLPDFAKEICDFAKDLATFCKNMPATESVTAATDNINKIITTVSNIVSTNATAITEFSKALKNLAKSGIDAFVKEFTSDAAKKDASGAGKAMVDSVIEGIEGKDKDVKTAGTGTAEEAVKGMGTQKEEAESAGKDLGDGLVIGIESKKTAAYNAGYELGKAAVQGEKDGQQSKSPSKATIKAGHWMGEGLIIGMNHMVKSVYKTGSGLGDSATKSISGAIAAIASSIDADMDMQPTIRPVVDLSEVRDGANAAAGLFTATPSMGVLANVRAINSSMNRRNQNGANDDVVSAIKDLKKTMNDRSGDTYTFGDLTYAEGTDVADAVKELVRAIRVGRRT